jgi:hypothetical protein
LSKNKWQIGPVKLSNGEDAFIDAINEGQEHYRYTGRVMSQDGFTIAGWHSDGRLMWGTTDHPRNLAPPPKKKIKVERWVNVFEDGGMVSWPTKEDADGCNQEARFALIQIDLEVEEGEGL